MLSPTVVSVGLAHVRQLILCLCLQSISAKSSSWAPYSRSKGLTEEGLARLGYTRAVICRPGVLLVPGGRGERRIPEKVAV